MRPPQSTYFKDDAIISAVQLSTILLYHGSLLPDKAIDLMDEAAARLKSLQIRTGVVG